MCAVCACGDSVTTTCILYIRTHYICARILLASDTFGKTLAYRCVCMCVCVFEGSFAREKIYTCECFYSANENIQITRAFPSFSISTHIHTHTHIHTLAHGHTYKQARQRCRSMFNYRNHHHRHLLVSSDGMFASEYAPNGPKKKERNEESEL